jgi:hypothetical protein
LDEQFNFDVKKSKFDKNELLLIGWLFDDIDSDLIESCIEWDIKVDPSSAKPHFLRCRFNSSSFSFDSRISRAINDSEL